MRRVHVLVVYLLAVVVLAGREASAGDSIGHIKTLPDGSAVSIRDAIITAYEKVPAGTTMFVESADRSAGIKVSGNVDNLLGESYTDIDGDGRWDIAEPFTDTNENGVYDLGEPYCDIDSDGHRDSQEPFDDVNENGTRDDIWDPIEGTRLSFDGKVRRVDGEWEIYDPNPVSCSESQEPLKPVYATLRMIANDPTQTLNYRGINMTGLLVRVSGKETYGFSSQGQQYFYIDDGSGYQDGLCPPSVRGVRCKTWTLPPNNPIRGLKGICRVEKHILTEGSIVNGTYYPPGKEIYVPIIWIRDR